MPCGIDLAIAWHGEDVSWLRELPSDRVCVHVYSTAAAATAASLHGYGSVRSVTHLPNTGREALCYVEHIQRIVDGRIQDAPLIGFVQATPHCSWDSMGGEACRREVVRFISEASLDDVEAKGGVIALSSIPPREFGLGLPATMGHGATRVSGRVCYLRSWANVSGMPTEGTESLYEAWEKRGVYVPGAQFVASRRAVVSLPPPLHGWLDRARALMQSTDLLDSGAARYSGDNCCVPLPTDRGRRRTCLPWLLERLWVPIFQLSSLAVAHDDRAERSGFWNDGAALAHALTANATRRDLRNRILTPMTLRMRWVERQYVGVSHAVKAALKGGLATRSLDRVVCLLAARHFAPPPDADLYRAAYRVGDRLTRALMALNASGASGAGGGGAALTDEHAAHAQRLVHRIIAVTQEASRSVHLLNATGQAALAALANPADVASPACLGGSPARGGHGGWSSARRAPDAAAASARAARICHEIKAGATSTVCEWPVLHPLSSPLLSDE